MALERWVRRMHAAKMFPSASRYWPLNNLPKAAELLVAPHPLETRKSTGVTPTPICLASQSLGSPALGPSLLGQGFSFSPSPGSTGFPDPARRQWKCRQEAQRQPKEKGKGWAPAAAPPRGRRVVQGLELMGEPVGPEHQQQSSSPQVVAPGLKPTSRDSQA